MSRAVIEAQCQAILHRGPDDNGAHVDGDLGIGMRRLSIIDIAGGHQPMATPDGRYTIVFNGEIYNHDALRQGLAAEGVAFTTRSDTEVILKGFAHRGFDIWRELEGMFAVAIWDGRERALHLARDPLGIKPLYVAQATAGGYAFASELKGLHPLPGQHFTPDNRAINDYFSFGYVMPPRSIYREVIKLAPGHVMTIAASGEPALRAFWEFRFHAPERRSEREWIEAFRERWLETVKNHLVSDVPVGAFLSGGVDSSAVVAAMAKSAGGRIKTFTIGFPVQRFDERPYARRLAEHLGCEHIEQEVTLGDSAEILPRIGACYDEPFADPSAVPTWYLSRLAAEHVKVVLSGDGGDELFAGYRRHLNERVVQRLGMMPGLLPAMGALAGWLPPMPVAEANYRRQWLQRVCRDAQLPDALSRFFSKTQITSARFRAKLYSEEFRSQFPPDGTYAALKAEMFGTEISRDPVEQFLFADITTRLPNVMLTKVDRASMAHSLEVRVPFLSHRLVDWSAGVPIGMKLHGRTGKYIVRRAVEPWLPPGFLDRPKQGFSIPLAEWFRGDLGSYAQSLWEDSRAHDSGYLDPNAVRQVFRDHRIGRFDHSQFLYALALFSIWWASRARSPR